MNDGSCWKRRVDAILVFASRTSTWTISTRLRCVWWTGMWARFLAAYFPSSSRDSDSSIQTRRRRTASSALWQSYSG